MLEFNPGDIIEGWEVLGQDRQSSKSVICRCLRCKREMSVNKSNLNLKKTKRCRTCYHEELKGSGNPTWKGVGDVPARYWRTLLQNCKRVKREITITHEYIAELFEKQNRLCAITKQPIAFNRWRDGHTASLDRIDSSKGYTEDNVQWVHKIVNSMKTDLIQEEFISWCIKVAEANQDKK